jgi:hypothetical protein
MTEKVAGYATVDAMVERLRTLTPMHREEALRSWITGTKKQKDKHVARVMAKLKEQESVTIEDLSRRALANISRKQQ